jgi:hypothetical protein
MVVSADQEKGVYAVEVVDPRNGSTAIIHAPPRQLRLRRTL